MSRLVMCDRCGAEQRRDTASLPAGWSQEWGLLDAYGRSHRCYCYLCPGCDATIRAWRLSGAAVEEETHDAHN